MCAIIYISARFLAQGDREFLHNILNKNESESGKELLVIRIIIMKQKLHHILLKVILHLNL